MTMSSHRDLAIKRDGGNRISVSDCKLQPLNLLIPGGAPIMVPKDKAWPGVKKKEAIKLRVPLSASNSYDAGEDDDLEEPVVIKTKSRRASKAKASSTADMKVKPEKKLDESCKKATKLDKLATEAKQRKKLEQQVREQEKYIAKLKAKYPANTKEEESQTHSEVTDSDSSPPSNSKTRKASRASHASTSGAVTDASEEVRRMIKSLKIKAAGAENVDFNPSEDSQLLARKENGESHATIAKHMGRTKKQIQKRHRELVALGKTAETAGTSGPRETTEAATTTGTDNDAPADAFGGLFDLGSLQAKLEATAAEQAQAEAQGKESGKEDDDSDEDVPSKAPKTSPIGILKTEGGGKKKGKKPPKLTSPVAVGGESGYESGSEDISTKVFIGNYARHLLTDKSTIPEADDKFDEDDCILMAVSDARRKGDRWKQMQADFANLTGRMVPVEVLQYKFGEGERPEGY
ncbi:hypothetical protein FJTKL_12611 [Diaporthe vaccinii]|uniref:Myb-like domain-containing protein n=1 Tax=Diaporthe vaccinii TaxID=105482 RepID=A0ABR4ED52_9PEZI